MALHAIIPLLDGNGDEIGIRFEGVGKNGFFEILYADVPGNSWNQNRLNKFLARGQELVDIRTPLTDPSLVDDPWGPNGSDPALPYVFWDAGDLVVRRIIFDSVTWDGTKLVITWHKAQ